MANVSRVTTDSIGQFKEIGNDINEQILQHMKRSATMGSIELRNNTMIVLRGQRHGRVYNVPNTGRVKYNKRTHTATVTYRKYTASAPNEAPAVRTGIFRLSWKENAEIERDGYVVRSQVRSNVRVGKGGQYLLGDILEDGTSRMLPRHYKGQVLEKSKPTIMRHYKNFQYIPH